MNWKNFKTWLDKNIIENEELMAKVKVEKRNDYGSLSTIVLTNFCDSLEATLDNNATYHLFPHFANEKDFKRLFDYQNCRFGKRTNQERINRSDYDLLEKLFDDWKSTQKNSKNMVNWKEINLDFTEEIAQEWQKNGLDFEQTKKWIEMGFRPNDYELVNFVRGNLGYDVESYLDNAAIETLRSIYQNDLENQSILLDEDLSEQEIIRRSIISQENDDLQLQEALLNSQTETKNESKQNDKDMGWLTDDNITYILENDELIRENNKDVQIKKDIANIYFQMERTKRGERIDNDFWNSLDTKKRYILLPVRVRGNHWSLLFFVNNRSTGKVLWIRYISSHPSPDEVSEEFKEIESFLQQVGGKYGNYNNINPKEVLLPNVPKQRNTWDCGVYLINFIKFLCVDEYHNLNGRNLSITDQSIKEFREKWKKEIGENKWCKWDTVSNIIISSMVEKRQLLEEKIIARNVNENIIDPSPQMKKMEREINELKKVVQDLALANTNFSKELKENRVQNKRLEKELQVIKKEVSQLKEVSLINGIQGKKEELDKILLVFIRDKEIITKLYFGLSLLYY